MQRTSEQEAIISAARERPESLMVKAYAGCGKTTTIEMLANALPPQPMLALAFNVKIKKELEKRLPPSTQVLTLNGLGHRAWASAIGCQPQLDDKKLGKIITREAKLQRLELGEQWVGIRQLISAVMMQGLVPSKFPLKGLIPDTPAEWERINSENFLDVPPEFHAFARDCLITSITAGFPTGNGRPEISFDDQIYLSTCLGGIFPRFPLVLVDEAQDLSPLNHLQVKKSAAGRLIVVGDDKQAIYAFRGADSSSMDKLRGLRQEWITLPLAMTFRCPRKIVLRQQDHAPGFRAAESNKEGRVYHFPSDIINVSKSVMEEQGWSWEHILQLQQGIDGEAHLAVLCRNNAPLLSLAMQLLGKGVGCVMLGRDIGAGLVKLCKKILKLPETPRDECLRLINQWRDDETTLARANDNPEKIAGIDDRAECLLAVLQFSVDKSARGLLTSLESLFARETGQVTLSTGHRSKGLEWDLVVHLDPWRIPSKHAKAAAARGNDKQLQQELNLQYVIETRAKHTLVLANLDDFT